MTLAGVFTEYVPHEPRGKLPQVSGRSPGPSQSIFNKTIPFHCLLAFFLSLEHKKSWYK